MRTESWGVCLTGGKAPELASVEWLLKRRKLCVAADSGLELADEYGVTPDLVVGDMDSLVRTELLEYVDPDRISVAPEDKDETDSEIGIRALRDHGCDRIALIGGGGGRLDHLVAILSMFDRALRPKIWASETSFVLSLDDSVEIHGHRGSLISFFPIGEGPWRMQSVGLQWSLDSLEWQRGDIGVSNRIVGSVMRVSMKRGRLIMIGDIDLLPGALG